MRVGCASLAVSERGAHISVGKLMSSSLQDVSDADLGNWQPFWCAEGDLAEVQPLSPWPVVQRLERFFFLSTRSERSQVLQVEARLGARQAAAYL